MATLDNATINKLANVFALALANAMGKGLNDEQAVDAVFRNPKAYLPSNVKTLVGADSAVHAHGPGGLFATPGIDNVVVNAHMVPMGLDQHLRVFPTVFMNPQYPSLTGFSEDTGSEPDGTCADCLGGTMQGCLLTSQFGHICRGSDEIHIMRTIQMINRGETTPLTLLGDVLGPGGIAKMPNTPSDWIEVTTRAEMVKVAILLQRKIEKMTWSGNPANNTAGGGYKEFPGLDMLVGTGKVDAQTGVTCPALDSLVMDFGMNDVGAEIDGRDIVQYLSTLEYYLSHNASRMNLEPVKWVIVMRPELWYELSAIWPCRYLTDRCGTVPGAANPLVLTDEKSNLLRDEMRNSQFITINGKRYPVITADGIVEEHGDPAFPNFNADLVPSQYASSIYMLPLTVRNGMSVLYWEHLDYSKADAQIAMTRSQNDFYTDGGRFFWTIERLRGCYKLSAEIDLRLVLRTPHLAGRIDSVRYTPLRHLRSPFFGDPYFVKGGRSTTTVPSLYSEWNLPVG